MAFVMDPDTDYDALYDERYYRGDGADSLVDYIYEAENPERTIRAYEWSGILSLVRRMGPLPPNPRWLDVGSGTGGLVAYARRHGVDAYGFEQGFGATVAREAGVPMVSQAALDDMAGTFDVVTAVEVLEHIIEPRELFTTVARLLRPGGLFFYTTGNAMKVRDLSAWAYVVPEVHVTFYTPATIRRFLEDVGLEPIPLAYGRGHEALIRFKVLKKLRRKNRSALESFVPWFLAGWLIDRVYGISAMPLARKPGASLPVHAAVTREDAAERK